MSKQHHISNSNKYKSTKEKEYGTAVDVLAAGLVIVAATFMILLYFGFSKSAQLRLDLDTVAKKYLYQMESTGYLTPENRTKLASDVEKLGARVIENHSTITRVKYGGIVALDITVAFDNPVTQMVNTNLPIFNGLIDDVIQYRIFLEATSKW